MKNRIILAAAAVALLLCGCDTAQPAEVTTAIETETVLTTQTEQTTAAETTSEVTTAQTTAATEATTITIKEIPFEDTPQNAYERLTNSFLQPNGGQIAPDDYAGMYSYFGKLFVCITTDEPSEYFTSLLGEYTCIKYQTVHTSFNRLEEICSEAVSAISEGYTVSNYYIDVPTNKAAVEVDSANLKEVQNFLKEKELSFTLDEIVLITAEEE